jgi:chromosome segregation ATPase
LVTLEQLLDLAQEEKDDLEEQLQDLAHQRDEVHDEELNELKEQLRLARARQAQAPWRSRPPSPSKVELERQNAEYERANRRLGENTAKLLREKKVAEDKAEQANSSATEWSRRWGELDSQKEQSDGILARAQQEAVKLQSELFVGELLQHQAYVMGDETLDDRLDHRLEDALAERDAVWEPIFECAVEEASTAKAELHDAFVVAGRLRMQRRPPPQGRRPLPQRRRLPKHRRLLFSCS